MKKKLQSRDTTIKVPLGKSSENTFKHMPFGTIESIDGYDFWVYEREAIEAKIPQLRAWREKEAQRLVEMDDEVTLSLKKPIQEGRLTYESVQKFKDHVLNTWKIREVEDYYRYSVEAEFSMNSADRCMFKLVGWLFEAITKMAALLGGALLYSGIVDECKTDKCSVWGGTIDEYNTLFLDKTYNEVLALLPKEKIIILAGIIRRIFEDKLNSIFGDMGDFRKNFNMLRADSKATMAGMLFLVNDRMGKIKHNQERGRKNQAKGVNDEEAERAKHDIEKALVRVHDLVRSGRRLKDACEEVCLNFHSLSNSKKFGQTRLPLKGVKKDLKPETLERYYHKKYGPKHNRKAKDAQGAIA